MATSSIAASFSNRALRALLKRHGACGEALDWLGDRDGERAWHECERADWMFWILGQIGVDRRLIIRAAVACVQPVVTAHVPADEPRPQQALDAALRWADNPSEENRATARKAADAAAAAAAAADAYAAYAAAAAAADATYAAAYDAAAAAYAADAAAYAADAAAYAADADARREARAASLKRSATTIRDTIPYSVVLAAVQGDAS